MHQLQLNCSSSSSDVKSTKLLGSRRLSSCCEAVEGDQLHRGFFQRVPLAVPRHPSDAVVHALFRILDRVLAS